MAGIRDHTAHSFFNENTPISFTASKQKTQCSTILQFVALITFGLVISMDCKQNPPYIVIEAIRTKQIPIYGVGMASKENYEFIVIKIKPLKSFSTADIELICDGKKAQEVGCRAISVGDLDSYASRKSSFEQAALTFSKSNYPSEPDIAFLIPESKGSQRLELKANHDGSPEPLKVKILSDDH
jgi:hypothetical protein